MSEVVSTPATIVVVTGLPGTGKSTLADALARTLQAPAFAGDWLLGALAPSGVLRTLDRSAVIGLCDKLLRSLLTRQLMLGQSAVVDWLVDDATIEAWRALSDGFGAGLVVVECVCNDAGLHRERLEARTRDIPGWHEVGWDHVQRMGAEYASSRHERLRIDAIQPLGDNLRATFDYLTD